jgi:aminoglycoside phosphotransferase (APT) family kinase protein
VTSVRVGQFYPKADSPLADSELRSFVGATPALAREQLVQALNSAGFSGDDLEPLAPGTLNDIWRFRSSGDQLVLKAARTPDGEALAIEAAVSDVLAAHAVDHPRVRAFDDSMSTVPFAFAITDYVEGRSMRELDGDEVVVERVLPSVAEAFRTVHQVLGTGYGLVEVQSGRLKGTHATWRDYLSTRLTEHLELLLANDIVTDIEAEELRLAAEHIGAESPPKLLHGDCGPHNIMVGPTGRPLLIDWEDTTFGDPEFELALWATFNPARRWPFVLDTYRGTTTPPSARFWRYFARITIAKVVVRTRLGYPDAPGRPSRVDRIRQALDGIRQSSN